MPSSPTGTLPTSHPLIAELSSLRQQLHQYQRSAHQSAIQLQGARLELSLSKEEKGVLREQAGNLRKEVEVLRAHPAPKPVPASSTALTELSLAHRRLSAKLDFTEAQLAASQLELATVKQDVHRLKKERESDRATINELRRVEDEYEEEMGWEKGERRKAEEQKKLCDLALQEYRTLVHSLDPTAVPPLIPPKPTSPNILHHTPLLDDGALTPPLSSMSVTSSETISNLLIGQKGVQQLFKDFSTTLSTKERAMHELSTRVDDLQHLVNTLHDQLTTETSIRVQCQDARDKALRDDASAAKVVERYMTFTQKTHATVHLHLDNLRTRSSATQSTLRKEAMTLRSQLRTETDRASRLRAAADEMTESLSRETAGRRREVGLRLKALATEEKRERKVEVWLDKVRRAREGPEGAVLEPDQLESLLDEGIEAVTSDEQRAVMKEKRSWRGLLGKKKKAVSVSTTDEESSITRVLLAEELVNTLVADLQLETERRMELERQRVDWLAREAVEGQQPGTGDDGDLMFDAENQDPDHDLDRDHRPDVANEEGTAVTIGPAVENGYEVGPEATLATIPPLAIEPSPEADAIPLVGQLRELFNPLAERYGPVQSILHDLSHSLSTLRASLPNTPSQSNSPSSPTGRTKRGAYRNLSLRPISPLRDPVLISILDSVHEVIEDARVDAEIGSADEKRVYHGFEALLGVGAGGSGVVLGKEVMQDARDYIADRNEWDGFGRLSSRVQDVETDLMVLQRAVHEAEGMDLGEPEEEEKGNGGERRKRLSIWSTLDLKTVTPTNTKIFPSLVSSPLLDDIGASDDEDLRTKTSLLTSVGSVGRHFSASVLNTPRRVGSLAGGLYRGKRGTLDVEEAKELMLHGEDGVE